MSIDQLTNNTGIPLSLAVWLATDHYDYNNDPNTISATTLLKPIREIVLARQNTHLVKEADVSTLVPSSMGNALHTAIEEAWKDPETVKSTLVKLGYPQAVVNKILINPSREELTDGCIPVYMEQRAQKKVGKYKVTGKSDFVIQGRLEDFKSTGVYGYITQSNVTKYIEQGSIYRWLSPDVITENDMSIQYLFTDWKKLDSIKDPNYPKTRLLEQKLTLYSVDYTERFITNILNQITKYENSPQEDLPRCSDKELWIKPTVWKYYKNPEKLARATKNFSVEHEAHSRLREDGSVGIVKRIEGRVEKCKYCSVVSICKQAQEYVNTSQLTL